METLWVDLARDEEKLGSPAWPGAVLKERGTAYAAGKLNAADWEQAKNTSRRRFHENKNPEPCGE